MPGTIPKRRTCHASCPRALEWYLEWYVHQYNVHALLALQTTHYWCDIETLKVWSLSLHICSRLEQDLSRFLYSDNDTELTAHKEEYKGMISGDKADRESIRMKLRVHRSNESRWPST